MRTHQAPRWTQFITLLGGSIAIAGFFMPWVGTGNSTWSAYRFFITRPLNPNACLIIIAFIASIVIVGINLYMLHRRTPWKSRIPILISSGVGLAILFEYQLIHVRAIENMISISVSLIGFWGTMIGFAVAFVGGLLIKTKEANGQIRVSVEQKQPGLIVLIGGIVALSCFFMPWEGIDNFSVSGFQLFQLLKMRPVVVITGAASIIIIAGSLYPMVHRTQWKLSTPILVSIGIGCGILFSYCIQSYFDQMSYANLSRELNLERPIKRSIKFGYWGTVIGFTVAAVGMFLTTRKRTEKQVEVPGEAG